MANNSKLYKKVWDVINSPEDEARRTWNAWAESSDPYEQEMCFFLAIQLRKYGRKKDAYDASKALSEYNPSLKSYNIYLASAYDLTCLKELPNDQLNAVFNDAWNFYKYLDFEVNITATLLKCCNYLIAEGLSDGEVFKEIYNKTPVEEKQKNSFIITQYYRRLIAENSSDKVLEYYDQLQPEMKENKAILNVVKPLRATEHIESNYIKTYNTEANKKITVISDKESAESYASILENFSVSATAVDLFSNEIVENLNKATHKSTTALVIIKNNIKIDSKYKENLSFVLGFCAHKFGRNGVKVLQYKDVIELQLNVLSNFEILNFQDDLDFLTLLGQLRLIRA